jgi:hypothetical protein
MHLPEHVHDAAESFGYRRSLAPQRIELALKRTVDPAKLSELSAEPLALLFARFERATQPVALFDQRRNHMAELVLAFSEPAGRTLRIVDSLDLTHLGWCLLVGSAGLRVRLWGLDGHLGRGHRGGDNLGRDHLGRESNQLVRCAGHE